jgi:hypothetical protein
MPRHSVRNAALVFTALAIVFTWPLVRHLTDAVPGDLGDPLLNTWILGWDAQRFRLGLQGFRGIWDAPIFYPYRATLGFSEHLFGIALFVAPIVWWTGSALAAYNVAFILSFALAGTGMFLLARDVTGRDDAAWIAGLIFAFAPSRLGHLGHLQVLMSGWMPLALWALQRFLATRSLASLGGFVLFTLEQCLSNNYFVYFLALAAAVVAVHGLYRARPEHRVAVVAGLAGAAAVVAAVLTPIAIEYFRVRHIYGFGRTLSDASFFGADLGAYLHGNEGTRTPLMLWRLLPFFNKPGGAEGELFMGAGALALAAAAVVLSLRRWHDPTLASARVYGVMLAAAVVVSLGPTPTAWGIGLPIGDIYRAVFQLVPGFDGLRVAARLSVVAGLAVSVLAAIGAAQLFAAVRPAAARALFVACVVLIGLEGCGAPLPMARVGVDGHPDRDAYEWIRDHAPGPILELPTGDFAAPLQSDLYEYQTLTHRQPIVNGASGYDGALGSFLGGGSSPFNELTSIGEGVLMLRSLGVRTIIVHPQAYADGDSPRPTLAALDALIDARQVVEHRSFPGVDIYRLAPLGPLERPATVAAGPLRQIPVTAFSASANISPDRVRNAFDGFLDTRWTTSTRQRGGEVFEITFAQPHDVALLRYNLTAPSSGHFPRHLVIQGTNDQGMVETLYDGSVLVQLGAALVRDPIAVPMEIVLGRNRTTTLRLLQTQEAPDWWSIDELSLWER